MHSTTLLAAWIKLGETYPPALAVLREKMEKARQRILGSADDLEPLWTMVKRTAFTQLVLLTPFAVRRWPEVAADWRTKKRWAFGVAVLSPVAYVLVLTAMSFTPVSTVAPAREVSIVIGAFFGAKLLKEADGRRRLWAAAVMALGVAALALG